MVRGLHTRKNALEKLPQLTSIEPILQVRDLTVDVHGKKSDTRILNGTSFSLYRGEILGLVGESGCGKSLLAKTLVRLENPAQIVSGTIKLDGLEISTPQGQKKMRRYRGRKISLVLQNPKSAMDPVFTVGRHFKDVFSIRHDMNDTDGKTNKTHNTHIQQNINNLLQAVGISSPKERSRQYPHQWSRGMLQRAQLQMTFATTPEIVILDEVTSALDPTVTLQILRLIEQLKNHRQSAVIFITHDLSVALEICDRIAVMQKGRIVETGPARDIILTPSYAYTKLLVAGMTEQPPLNPERTLKQQPIIKIQNISVQFPLRSNNFFSHRSFHVVRDISLEICRKEIFCLIGESGSGKSTLMNAILGFCAYQEGKMVIHDESLQRTGDSFHQCLKSKSQVVFQDPVTSLNPYQTLGESIMEPLRAQGMTKWERKKIAEKLATEVGLPHSLLSHFPRNASVGQNQRACIARALSVEPDYLFLDEPLSALDAVNQREISILLARLTTRHGLTCFLISHDLHLVKEIATTVAVMYMGRIVENAPVASFFTNPTHPYSKALLSNTLKPGIWMDKRIVLEGEAPSPHNPPSGCVFHPRCPKAIPVCEQYPPSKKIAFKGHEFFCHLDRNA